MPRLTWQSEDAFCVDILNSNCIFYVEPDSLQDYELLAAYIETFYHALINGHSYLRRNVLVKKGDIVFDCGACEGFFTRYALLRGAEKVICIEPSAKLCIALRKTFRNEIESEKVIIVEAALADRVGKNKLIINKDMYCASSCSEDFASDFENVEYEDIAVVTIDSLVEDYNISHVDIIKMDIENAEVDAIVGAEKTIRTMIPDMMIATYHSYENAHCIYDLVRSYGDKYNINYAGCYMDEKPYRPYLTVCVGKN